LNVRNIRNDIPLASEQVRAPRLAPDHQVTHVGCASFGVNCDQIVNMTEYSDWADADGFTPAGGLHFDESSLILGYSIALGSGNGTADIYLDNLQVGGVTMDFYG
jgi:hypothetical protein